MKKRGITLLALITTIIVALILLSTVIISYDDIIDNTKKRDLAMEVYTLRQQILDYEFINGTYPLRQEINLDLNNIPVDSQNQFSGEPGYDSKSVVLSTIDLYKAGVNSISRGMKAAGENDIYAFSTSTKKVYYIMGQEIAKTTYYTLTDELYKLIDIKNVE